MTYVLPVWDWRHPHKILDLVVGERWKPFLPSQRPRRRDLLRGVLARRLQGKVNPLMPFWDFLKDALELNINALLSFWACMARFFPSRQIVGAMFSGMMLGFQMLLRDQPTIIMGGEGSWAQPSWALLSNEMFKTKTKTNRCHQIQMLLVHQPSSSSEEEEKNRRGLFD